jgi:small subunit ribosomal protein S21
LEIKVNENNVEKAIRDLKIKLQKDGLFKDLKKRRFYEKPSEKLKRKQIEARKKKSKAQKFRRHV